jgi:4-amino-4-deoxy-L-arabinose transferase-like glycosyltransferase
MQHGTLSQASVQARSVASMAWGKPRVAVGRRGLILWASLAVVAVLAFYRLGAYPLTWFDEGSHLHVPKALVRYGVYADYSSEGFRYFGPTTGVGPTVMLPIAAVFSAFGIGLTQARLVMAVYLLACILAFYTFAFRLGGRRFAWVATALLVASRGAPLLEYGRQVLGEVPATFFLVTGLLVWFSSLSRPSLKRTALAGILFGLAMVTKQQFVILLAPTLGLGWLANLLYYRAAPQRSFILPAALSLVMYAGWQAILVLFLSSSSVTENLRLLGQAAGGAALVFSPDLMQASIHNLLGAKVYLGALTPALLYAASLATPRTPQAMRWGLLTTLVAVNLIWYVLGSVSWLRYAFPGLAISALLIAKLFLDWTGGFRGGAGQSPSVDGQAGDPLAPQAFRWTGLGWVALIIVVPLTQTVHDLVRPPFNAPVAMAEYMNAHLPTTTLVETWEPEMGFLTDHTYHFPPQELLNAAVGYIWRGSASPSGSYDFVRTEKPTYVLVGEFGRWVDMYPADSLAKDYRLVTTIGGYELYTLR